MLNTLTLINVAMVVAGYLCGSIASAVIVCRLMGLEDPRGGGSGNPGATNVLRLHGRTAAALTLVIPVFVLTLFAQRGLLRGLTAGAVKG